MLVKYSTQFDDVELLKTGASEVSVDEDGIDALPREQNPIRQENKLDVSQPDDKELR